MQKQLGASLFEIVSRLDPIAVKVLAQIAHESAKSASEELTRAQDSIKQQSEEVRRALIKLVPGMPQHTNWEALKSAYRVYVPNATDAEFWKLTPSELVRILGFAVAKDTAHADRIAAQLGKRKTPPKRKSGNSAQKPTERESVYGLIRLIATALTPTERIELHKNVCRELDNRKVAIPSANKSFAHYRTWLKAFNSESCGAVRTFISKALKSNS